MTYGGADGLGRLVKDTWGILEEANYLGDWKVLERLLLE